MASRKINVFSLNKNGVKPDGDFRALPKSSESEPDPKDSSAPERAESSLAKLIPNAPVTPVKSAPAGKVITKPKVGNPGTPVS